jgi:hypothetical protein
MSSNDYHRVIENELTPNCGIKAIEQIEGFAVLLFDMNAHDGSAGYLVGVRCSQPLAQAQAGKSLGLDCIRCYFNVD